MISLKSVLQFIVGAGCVAALGLGTMTLWPKPQPIPGWKTIRPPKDVMTLLEYRGDILSGGKTGLVRIDRTSGQVLAQVQADQMLQYVTSLVLDGVAGYWVGHADGLSHFDGSAWRTYTTSDGLPDNQVLTVARTLSGVMWVGTSKGIARLANGKWQVFHTSDGLASEAASVIFEDRQGRVWFGDGQTTTGGLSMFDGQTWHVYRVSNGLAHNVVNAIFQDSQGAMWFATGFSSQGGVSRFDGTQWQSLHQADGLAGGKARSIFQDASGTLWVGSEYDGIARFDGNPFQVKSKVYTPQQGLAGWEVKTILQDSTGGLWLGTENGITHISNP